MLRQLIVVLFVFVAFVSANASSYDNNLNEEESIGEYNYPEDEEDFTGYSFDVDETLPQDDDNQQGN